MSTVESEPRLSRGVTEATPLYEGDGRDFGILVAHDPLRSPTPAAPTAKLRTVVPGGHER